MQVERDGEKYAAKRLFLGLDDLCVRFLLNGPKEDLETAERICFRVEEAQWYYEDFIRPLDPMLPSMALKHFCEAIFAHCPLLLHYSQDHCMSAFDAFLSYKKRVPVRGAIMLNQDMDKVVLVKGWKKSANWSFPRGKINKDEDDLDCAIREVYEETGYDLEEAGLVPENRQVKSIELNMHEQQIRLFLFRGIPTDTHFEPRTRKEISTIDWWRLSDLPTYQKGKLQAQQQPVYNPTNFYMVAPFLAHVKKWIAEQKKHDLHNQIDNLYITPGGGISQDEDQGVDSNVKATSREEVSITKKTSVNGASGHSNPFLDTTQQSNEGQSHPQNLPVNNIGNALLSLLQSKPTDNYQKPLDDLPHTPLDHDTSPAYIPQTPHHEDPKPPLFSSMQSAPGHQIYEQSEEESFCYKQSQVKKHYEKMIEAQKHIQAQQQTLNSGAHPYQPQHLIHPQPLPPYVQRAVFAQSPIPDSPLYSKASSHLNLISMSPQSPSTLPIMIPETNKQAPPKLTNHTLALLNSFKSHKNGHMHTNSYDKQNPERTPESNYSYIDMPCAPTPPVKHLISDQTENYNDIFTSSWSSALQEKVAEKDTRRIQRQDFELAYGDSAVKHNFSNEPITPKISTVWQSVSTIESDCLENNQVHNLAFHQDQYDSWGSQIKHPNPSSVYNEQDIINQSICAQNTFCSATSQPQPPKYALVQNSIKHHQVPREPYQNTTAPIFPHQAQELPASSLSKKKTFPSAALPSNDNDGVHSLNPLLDSENYLMGKHRFNSLNNLKGFNSKSTENFNSSSARAPPGSKTPSAVELSAADPSSDTTKMNSASLDSNPITDHTASITNHFSESTKLPFGATRILLRPPNQEKIPKSSLRSTNTQSTYLKASGDKPSVKSHQKSPTKDSSTFSPGVMEFHSNQSLPVKSIILAKPEFSKPPESSKIPEYKYVQPCHQQNKPPRVGKEALLQSHHVAPNTFSLPNSSTFPTSKTGGLVTNLPTIRKKSQPISPSDKGFLLSYLEDVVAKGANSS